MRSTALAQLAPGLQLLLERLAPLSGDVVIAPLASGFLLLPLADDQAVGDHLVQTRIERALAPGERAVRIAMYGGGDLVAVHRLAAEERQDQQRERAFEQFRVHGRGITKGVRYIEILCIIAGSVAVSRGRFAFFSAAIHREMHVGFSGGRGIVRCRLRGATNVVRA